MSLAREELTERVYGVISLAADTSVREVAGPSFDAISNPTNNFSFATRFAHRRIIAGRILKDRFGYQNLHETPGLP